MSSSQFKGWTRPGPRPPGGVEIEPGETLDYIAGHFRIFQYERGHRFSTDDVLTAWYGTQWAPRVERAADLGSGIGSVALLAAWRLPAARVCTIEAQEISHRLARKSVVYNGLGERFKLFLGDLRVPDLFAGEEPFDLVLGSPPYFPEGTATRANHAQAVPARIEVRGTVADYAAAAARILAPGGVFAFVFPTLQLQRAEAAIHEAGLFLLRRRPVVFKRDEDSMITLFLAVRAADLPESLRTARDEFPVVEPALIIRERDGRVNAEYAAVKMSFGFPPGEVGEPG